uniref:Uncharacterized protein n=1 Tax=Laticauda laticaudata TaxID=8630 RepID=A0A8C5SUC2_LATLA
KHWCTRYILFEQWSHFRLFHNSLQLAHIRLRALPYSLLQVLVLGNKRDLAGALDEKELIEKMNLSAIQDREICCYSISCKEKDNIGKLESKRLGKIKRSGYVTTWKVLMGIESAAKS